MRIKRLLALVLSAAMALTLFAGCCSPSLLQLLLDLLQEQYQNITVTAEDDLDAALREAVSEYDTLEEMDAALAQTLGKTVEFESLRSARAGDKAFDLVYRAGTDTEAMARLTYTEWNKILGSLPASGQYLADLAVRKAGGGYYILVDITVKKGSSSGGNHNSGDDEENSQPVDPTPTLKGYEWDKENENTILVHTNKGLQQVFFEDMATDDPELMTARAGGFEDITIKLDSRDDYVVSQTFDETLFLGTLTSTEDPEDNATINISQSGMFLVNNGTISNINFCVTGEINGIETIGTLNLTAFQTGVVAYANTGAIESCNVTFKNDGKIVANSNSIGLMVSIGGIVGANYGAIEKCSVTDGVIEVNDVNSEGAVIYVGGIAGYDASGANAHPSEITGSTVEKIRFNIKTDGKTDGTVYAHDIAGYWNNEDGKPTGDCSGNEFTVNGSPYVPGE